MLKSLTVFALAAVSFGVPAAAQEMTRSDVVIYRAAPGHQAELLKFLARQEEAAKAAGLKAAQLYVHQFGASWDFVLITPHSSDADNDKQEAAGKKMGMTTGPAMGLEFRQHIAEHSDTVAAGPYTISQWLARTGQ